MPFIGESGKTTKTPSSSAGKKTIEIQKQIPTVTIKTNKGRTYILNQDQVDWLKTRYASTAASAYKDDVDDQVRKSTGQLPAAYEAGYKNTTLDQKLYAAGLPSEKYIEQYIGAYINWMGDGQTYSFDKPMSDSMAQKYKASWEYEYTFEDQDRKAQGKMPAALEKKYGDNYRDYTLMQQGLPPESMLSDYVGAWDTIQYETAKRNQLYDAVTLELVKAEQEKGAYNELTEAERLKIFNDVYTRSDYDDVRHLFQKSPTEQASSDAPDELSEYDAIWAAMSKEPKATDEPLISYADFESGYEKRKSTVLVDQAAYDTAVLAQQEAKTKGVTSKATAQEYVKLRIDEDPAKVFADMYDNGVPLTQITNAWKYWKTTTNDPTKIQALNDAHNAVKERHSKDRSEQRAANQPTPEEKANARLEHYSASAKADEMAAFEAQQAERKDQNSALKVGMVQKYDSGATSTVTADEAEQIFRSHLVYDEKGKMTGESVNTATNMLYDAGASTSVVKEVGKRVGLPYNGVRGFDNYKALMAFQYNVNQRDLEQRKELVEKTRQTVVGGGSMTNLEFDNAVYRQGWRDAVDTAQAAQDYYTEHDKPLFEANGEKLPDWFEMTDEERANKIKEYEETARYNPEVDKSPAEIIKGRLTQAFVAGAMDIAAGAVSLADMSTAFIQGRDEQWRVTEHFNKVQRELSLANVTNQSVASRVVGYATDIAQQLERMYMLNALGSGVSSMAFGANQGISTIANATKWTTKGLNALIKGANFTIQSSPFIATAMGQYYSEAMQSGATTGQAVLYGTVCGLMEGALEAVGTEQWAGRALGSNAVAKEIISAGKNVLKAGSISEKAVLIKFVASMIGNGLEEVASYGVSTLMKRKTYDKDAQWNWNDAMEQGLGGVVIGFFGAAMGASADTNENVVASFLDTEAGSRWAQEQGAAATTDLLVSSVIAGNQPDSNVNYRQMQDGIMSQDDYEATIRDMDQHYRQMDSDQQKYNTHMAKIDAELAKKQGAVDSLADRVVAAQKNPKLWAKLVEQHRVAESELDVEKAQAAQKRTERTSAFTELTEQHKIAIAKAQSRFIGHAVSMNEAFTPEIKDLDAVNKSGVAVMPTELGARILSKMDAARAGKLMDYFQRQATIQQDALATANSKPLDAPQPLEATTVQPTPENASAAATAPSGAANIATENAGNIKSEATPANPAETMGVSGISVGAMTSKKGLSEGRTAISQFFTNTLENMAQDDHTKAVNDAMQALDETFTYDVVSEKESIAKAQERLARGVTPELIQQLRSVNAWTGVDADTAMGILAQYEQNGKDTGDYTDYYNWLTVMQDRLSEGGRGIQALAKYTRDSKVQAVMVAAKNVKKADKEATPKQKNKVTEQTNKIAKVVDDAIKTNATPDAVESEVTKVAKKQTAKSVKDAFIRLQNKQMTRAAFDEHVNKEVKKENGLTAFTGEDAKRVIELLDLAEQQTDSYERRRYQSMAAQIIANTEPVTFGEKFRSVQRIMMLLNTRTMIRNVAANVVFAPFEWAKDLPATLVDMVVSKKTGERTTTVSLQKQAAAVKGFKRGLSEVGKDIKYGVNTGKATGKYEMTAKDIWRGKFMNFLDDMVGYGLNAGDRPFYEAAYDEFAMNEQLLGHDLNSDEVQQKIVNLSLDRVFQGHPAIYEGMKRIRNGIDQFAPPFGTLLIPFTQTPANLADKILDYSVGIVRAGKQLYDSAKNGKTFDQKLFVDRVGRSITGTGLMILGYALAKAGVIHMAGTDDKERHAMKNAGVTAYSVQLGDASIAINWAEPVGSIMLMGATLAQQGANGESLNVLEGGKMMFNSFFDNSIFSNLTALLGGGYGDAASGIENFALGSTTQFLPSTLSAIARTLDPYERDTYDPNKLLAQGKRILSYFPGLRNSLPFKYGTDGKPVESNYGDEFYKRALNTMLNPALVDKKSGDAVNDEIYRLYQGGFTDQLLPTAAKTLANTTLTAEQRRELQRVLGEATYNAAERVINGGGYESMTDEQRVTALGDAITDAATTARNNFKATLGK